MEVETLIKGTEPNDKNIMKFDLKNGLDCDGGKMFICTDKRDSKVMIFITLINEELNNKLEIAEDKLHKIEQWCKAYPVKVFSKMEDEDWNMANKVLNRVNIKLGRITASNFRHVLKGIERIIKGEK